jgi:transglutaminase-like putative cysteine protease
MLPVPKVIHTTIQPGNAGTRETLVIMRNLALKAAYSEFFYRWAMSFRNTDHVNTIRDVYTYTPEEIETLIAPEYNLQYFMEFGTFIGDCDDIAMLYGAIFNVRGIRSRFVAMRTERDNPEFLHVVIEAYEDNRWKRFDPTVQPGLRQVDYGQMMEYL